MDESTLFGYANITLFLLIILAGLLTAQSIIWGYQSGHGFEVSGYCIRGICIGEDTRFMADQKITLMLSKYYDGKFTAVCVDDGIFKENLHCNVTLTETGETIPSYHVSSG